MLVSPMLLADGYKISHIFMGDPQTTRIYSNWTPRMSRIVGQDKVVFFGLQYFLEEYLTSQFGQWFSKSKREVVDEYQDTVVRYLGKSNADTKHLEELHDLGYLPLQFRALPEGTLCPLRVPMLTVENTHDSFAWLTNYVETLMSNILWMPCTSATTAYRLRKLLDRGCDDTGGSIDFVPFQGHDFSMRGMAGLESACLSGAGHLLSFVGTDTIPALKFVDKYYNGKGCDLLGCSVPASEHSIVSCGGPDNEIDTINRILDVFPSGIISYVSDTYSLWDNLTKTLPALRDRILSRDGTFVVRPDSGDPVKIVCGDNDSDDYCVKKGVIELLWDEFGGTINEKGFKQLSPKVGCIYGDSITYERMNDIIEGLKAKGFASTNMVYGVGSFSYTYTTRDTYGFAMKATWAQINGEGRDLFKKPVTDNGMKFSATGRLAVIQNDEGELEVIERATPEQEANSLLQPVWQDGELLRIHGFETIRETLKNQEKVLV